jgi:hypothetical protein
VIAAPAARLTWIAGTVAEVRNMGIGVLQGLVGEWELATDLPGGEGISGRVVFEAMGDVLVERTTVPVPEAPDSHALILASGDGRYVQHYFDARGVARLYEMTFDGRTWTLERTKPDFSPLHFCQRFTATVSDDGTTITGEWHTSPDGRQWQRDFGLTYTRRSNG